MPPSYYFALLYVAKMVLQGLVQPSGGHRAGPYTRSVNVVRIHIALYVLIALVSILLIPFYDPVIVHAPSGVNRALSMSRENFTQLLYLIFVVTVFVAVSFEYVDKDRLRQLRAAFIYSTLFVVCWGWFQVAADLLHIPYPYYIFNNSLSFGQEYHQHFAGFKRINSVAPEPSTMAAFLSIPLSILFTEYLASKRTTPWQNIFLLWVLLTAIASTSTTAVFAIVISVVVSYWVARRANLEYRVQYGWRLASVAVVLGGLAVAVWVYKGDVAASATVDKIQSASGVARLNGALSALELFIQHPLLGVGWGSNRSFDYLSNILATTGLIGAWLFFGGNILFVIYTLRGLRSGYFEARGMTLLVSAMLAAFISRFLIKFISEPDVIYLDIWLIMGTVLAVLRGVRGRAPRTA